MLMNYQQTKLVNKFLDVISAKCNRIIKITGESKIHIHAGLIYQHSNIICPNAQFCNSGYFFRSVNKCMKTKHNLATILKRNSSTRTSFLFYIQIVKINIQIKHLALFQIITTLESIILYQI